jgi:phosphatidylglycerophosphate synthase
VPLLTGPARFYVANRGGGLYSEAVSQRLGALIAASAASRGLRPAALSLANLAVGLAASLAVIVAPGRATGLVGLVGWQLAYGFDCADGQLARVTARTSAAGARLDVLCDLGVQIGVVTALAAAAQAAGPPTWLVAAFAGTWLVNVVTAVLQSQHPASLVRSRSPAVRVVKLVRDYGAVVLLAGLTLVISPQWTKAFMAVFTGVNGGFLLASIGFTARDR